MKHLWEMTLDELLNPQGHACSCGRVHRCGLKMLRVGKGAVDALPEALAATQVQRPFVVADAHTYQAAGQKVEEVLQAAGIPYTLYRLPGDKRIEPDEWAMGSLRSCSPLRAAPYAIFPPEKCCPATVCSLCFPAA